MNVLEKYLFNLQTIASIPKHKRISTSKEFIAIDQESLLPNIWRWKSGDNREKAVVAICNIVRTIIKFSKLTMESKYLFDISADRSNKYDKRINDLKRINTGLTEANRGIDNLCETYANDTTVTANLKPLISEISVHTANITKLLTELARQT